MQDENKNKDNKEELDFEFEETNEMGDETSLKDKIKKLREALKNKEKEAKENLDGWQRARAELVNNEKKTLQERSDFLKYANMNLIDSLLSTLDNFEMAKRNKEVWEKVDSAWRSGMDYIFTNFKNVLLDTGLKEISPKENDNFDVKTMEATEEVEGNDENDHKVAQLVQTGYSLHDKLLRPAKVKIYIKK